MIKIICFYFSIEIVSNLSFWSNSERATDGLADVAESGATQTLETELKTKVGNFSNVRVFDLVGKFSKIYIEFDRVIIFGR